MASGHLFGSSVFTSASEIKALLSNRSDSGALITSLSILLRQLHDAWTSDQNRGSLSAAVFLYFEGSQSAVADFVKLWDWTDKVIAFPARILF